MPSILKFKSHITSFIRPNRKSTFGIHDPNGIRFLFMIRLNLSPLRSHKFRHNFIDTPSEICVCSQGIEDTSHFLLLCPLYINPRLSLHATANDLVLKYNLPISQRNYRFFLYGHHLMNHDDNKSMLVATIKFIKETKRFSS